MADEKPDSEKTPEEHLAETLVKIAAGDPVRPIALHAATGKALQTVLDDLAVPDSLKTFLTVLVKPRS